MGHISIGDLAIRTNLYSERERAELPHAGLYLGIDGRGFHLFLFPVSVIGHCIAKSKYLSEYIYEFLAMKMSSSRIGKWYSSMTSVTMTLRQHLISRCMDPDRPGLLLSEETGTATFLLYNLSGQLVGYQQYRPDGTKSIRNDEKHRDLLRYFTFVGDEGDGSRAGKKRLAIWGLDTVHLEHRDIFLTEGVFDAVKLHNLGLPAVAVLANDPQVLRPWLRALAKRVIAICDRDAAGGRLGSLADMRLVVPEPFHDLGDMPQQEVEAWLRTVFIHL